MGSTQSKPTNTQGSNKEITHLYCMKHCENANVMQCMIIQDHLNKTQPKNFTNNSTILKNPKNFQKKKKKKNQKPRSKCMKCMINEREEIIPEVETKVQTENQVRKVKGLKEKCLVEKGKSFCQERLDRKEKKNHAKAIYRKMHLDGSRSC